MPEPASRPLIAIPARFSENASALRSRAEVIPRAMAEAVFAAGGEPIVLHPHAPNGTPDPQEAGRRLHFADAVLLPGGGDLAPHWAGQQPHPRQYGIDEEQDAFDLAIARAALAHRLPLLSICRGTQVVNVALGGNLVQDMAETVGNHRHRVHEIDIEDGSAPARWLGKRASISCYHHQCIDRLGAGLHAVAHAEDGVIEAVTLPEHAGWFLGVQWHPEDAAASDPAQAGVFAALVTAAAEFRRSGRPR